MTDREPQTIAERVYEIRRLLGPDLKTPLQGGVFAKRLNAIAARYGLQFKYDHSVISKIENGGRRVSIEEVPLFAALDPKQRGANWLAWGGDPATLLGVDPSRDHQLTATEAARARAVETAHTAPRPTKHSAGGRKRRDP